MAGDATAKNPAQNAAVSNLKSRFIEPNRSRKGHPGRPRVQREYGAKVRRATAFPRPDALACFRALCYDQSVNDVTASTQRLRALYDQAFSTFGTMALWNSHPVADPLPADARAVARALRKEGNMDARRLAEEMEAAARAVDFHAPD